MKFFIYALRDYDEKQYLEEYAKQFGFEYESTFEYPSYENIDRVKGCDGVSIITNPIDAAFLDKMHSLGVKYLATRSIGYEHIDIKHAYELGMRVSHVTYSPNSVANYAIMLMLIACRQIPFIMKKAVRQDFSLKGNLGKELSESTVGVLGTGNIGATVVRHLSGFGCRILMNDVYEKEDLKQFGTYTDLETLYRESDIVTIHVPALPQNYHMISREEIAKMKDGVILVNAARGSLVDTEAMIDGLESGKIGFAALDTIEHEDGLYYLDRSDSILPNRDRAILMALPNVFLTPHMAFYTEQAVSDMIRNACIGLVSFARGEETSLEVPH